MYVRCFLIFYSPLRNVLLKMSSVRVYVRLLDFLLRLSNGNDISDNESAIYHVGTAHFFSVHYNRPQFTITYLKFAITYPNQLLRTPVTVTYPNYGYVPHMDWFGNLSRNVIVLHNPRQLQRESTATVNA